MYQVKIYDFAAVHGGEGEIRTLGRDNSLQGFSKPPH